MYSNYTNAELYRLCFRIETSVLAELDGGGGLWGVSVRQRKQLWRKKLFLFFVIIGVPTSKFIEVKHQGGRIQNSNKTFTKKKQRSIKRKKRE